MRRWGDPFLHSQTFSCRGNFFQKKPLSHGFTSNEKKVSGIRTGLEGGDRIHNRVKKIHIESTCSLPNPHATGKCTILLGWSDFEKICLTLSILVPLTAHRSIAVTRSKGLGGRTEIHHKKIKSITKWIYEKQTFILLYLLIYFIFFFLTLYTYMYTYFISLYFI